MNSLDSLSRDLPADYTALCGGRGTLIMCPSARYRCYRFSKSLKQTFEDVALSCLSVFKLNACFANRAYPLLGVPNSAVQFRSRCPESSHGIECSDGVAGPNL